MLAFLRQAIGDFNHTGAVLPSSRRLARQMTRSLRAAQSPRRILEVGPGTGPFTTVILATLAPEDTFDIVEINPTFCRHLERTLLEPHRRANPDHRVRLHEAAIQDAPLESGYDHIVCGLPFNNFPIALVEAIFDAMLGLLRSGGDLHYFEYAGVRHLKAPFVGSTERRRLGSIGNHSRELRATHAGHRRLVIANVPPAFAVRLLKD